MAKQRKNYYRKPVGSVAVLGYYVVVPFYNNQAKLTQLLARSSDAIDIVERSIQYACAHIQSSFIEGDQLFDDGLVEMHSIVSETHVTIYMKLPATISVHSAIAQVRIHSSRALLSTGLKAYVDIYRSLYSRKYLAMCAPVDPSFVGSLHSGVYGSYIKTFFLENNLEGDPANVHLLRKKVLGGRPFMSEKVTNYV